jgi:hypothetical protein
MNNEKENRRSFGLKTLFGSVGGFLSGLGLGRQYAEVDHDKANYALRVVLLRWQGALSCHPRSDPVRWHVTFHDTPVRPGMPWMATLPPSPSDDPGQPWPRPQRTWEDPVQAILESERLMLEQVGEMDRKTLIPIA